MHPIAPDVVLRPVEVQHPLLMPRRARQNRLIAAHGLGLPPVAGRLVNPRPATPTTKPRPMKARLHLLEDTSLAYLGIMFGHDGSPSRHAMFGVTWGVDE